MTILVWSPSKNLQLIPILLTHKTDHQSQNKPLLNHKIKEHEHEWFVFIIIRRPVLICTLKNNIHRKYTHENFRMVLPNASKFQNTVFHNSDETYYHLAKPQHCNNIFPSPS